MKIKGEVFFKSDQNPWEKAGEGISRQITGYDVNIMMVKVKFEKGSIGYEHKHHHAQTSYVVKGVFDVTIDGVTTRLNAGDAFYVEPNLLHGAICQEEGILIDVFSPLREDFLK
jgi:quercetin dioxygenase-like cupin family protein